jgi:hypothetical protein
MPDRQGLSYALPSMVSGPVWRSDTLALAILNAGGYFWSYWASEWSSPHIGTYLCSLGALISFVPAVREFRNRSQRTAILLGLATSCAVLLHIFLTPCTGGCK